MTANPETKIYKTKKNKKQSYETDVRERVFVLSPELLAFETIKRSEGVAGDRERRYLFQGGHSR